MDISENRLITEGNLVWKIPNFFKGFSNSEVSFKTKELHILNDFHRILRFIYCLQQRRH